jgi:hypothetical protein
VIIIEYRDRLYSRSGCQNTALSQPANQGASG